MASVVPRCPSDRLALTGRAVAMPVLFLDCLTGMVELWHACTAAGRPTHPGQHRRRPARWAADPPRWLRHLHQRPYLLRCRLAGALRGPSAHRFSWHRRFQLHRPCRGGEPGHQGPHHQGLWRYQRGRAHYHPRHGRGAQRGAHGSRRSRRQVAADRRAAALRQDPGDHRPRRCRPRGRAHRTRAGHAGARLEPLAGRRAGRPARRAGAGAGRRRHPLRHAGLERGDTRLPEPCQIRR